MRAKVDERQRLEDAECAEEMLQRVAENYCGLFRFIYSSIQTWVDADDPTNDYDDGMLGETTNDPINMRSLKMRARSAADKLLGAFPDAFAQAIFTAAASACPRLLERYGQRRFRRVLLSMMASCMHGMRISADKFGHWNSGDSELPLVGATATAVTTTTAAAASATVSASHDRLRGRRRRKKGLPLKKMSPRSRVRRVKQEASAASMKKNYKLKSSASASA